MVIIEYDLMSMVIHSGGLSGGHYTAMCKKKKQWVYFNDSRWREMKASTALSKDAYILFYRRKD